MTRRTDSSAATEPTGPAYAGALRSARRLSTLKGRRAAEQFLTEGPQAVREAVAADLVQRLFVTKAGADRHPDLVQDAANSGAVVSLVSDAELAALTDTVTPQGLVAVCRTVETSLEDVIAAAPRLVVVCAQVRDPGNAGTVIRCADAFGADAVVLTHGSVDAHNPKTVRASVGSLFHLPVVEDLDLEEATDALKAAGLTVIAADGSGSSTLLDLDLTGPIAWVFGNEAWGLPPADLATADIVAKVPMWGAAESLNLSTAAAVCLYATAAAQHTSTPAIEMPTTSPTS
jgi:RNA methyltransferase, TrmH family